MTDSSGAILNTYEYAAFGDLYTQTGTTINPYLYTGQRFDATTDQYYLRAREYDPAVGRFLSRDTWAVNTWNPVEVNRYGYAAGNPVTWSDPTGYFSLKAMAQRLQQIALSIPGVSYASDRIYMAYSRVIFRVQQLIPWFQHAVCLGVGLSTDADLGPACDLVSDPPSLNVSEWFRSISRASQSDAAVQAVETTRKAIWGMIKHNTGADAFNSKNFAHARLYIDDVLHDVYWAVSEDTPLSKRINEHLIELAGVENVAVEVTDLFDTLKPGHAEPKLFSKILTDLIELRADGLIRSGQKITVQIFTERRPCPECGGLTGIDGVIRQFGFRLTKLNLDSAVDVLFFSKNDPVVSVTK